MLLCVGRVKREVKKELLKILQKSNYWRAAKHWQGSETTLTSSGLAVIPRRNDEESLLLWRRHRREILLFRFGHAGVGRQPAPRRLHRFPGAPERLLIREQAMREI